MHEMKRKHKDVEQGEASIKEESHFVDRRKKQSGKTLNEEYDIEI